MKTFLSILLAISTLSSCAKKVSEPPVSAKLSTTTNNTVTADTGQTNSGKGTSTGTGIGSNSGSTGSSGSNSAANDGSLTYLALGDSYTVGQSVPQAQSFPFQLTTQLNIGATVKTPTVIATTGWTTYQLINGINNSGLTTHTYDFVTLLIGVNDQYNDVGEDTYRAQFQDVLNVAIRFAKGKPSRVFVLSIPDYSVTPFASDDQGNIPVIARQIDEFNAINKSISGKAGVNYLDITDISRQAATDPTLLAGDGLHPSAKMYGLWIQRLLPLVKSKLN